jgi:hypothetical protein
MPPDRRVQNEVWDAAAEIGHDRLQGSEVAVFPETSATRIFDGSAL